MERKTKKITALMLSFIMLLSMLSSVTVAAASSVSISGNKTIHCTLNTSSSLKVLGSKYNNALVAYVSNYKKSLKITSSNPSVAVPVKTEDSNGYATIVAKLKKTGKTVFTIKADNRTFKSTIYVYKYTSPISSIQLGKKKISGSIFNKSIQASAKYSKYASKKCSFKVTPKAGWKIDTIRSLSKKGTEELIYGTQINWITGKKTLVNKKSIAITGGAPYTLDIFMKHTKTGRVEMYRLKLVK